MPGVDAHIGGFPVEEAIPAFISMGAILAAAAHLALARVSRWLPRRRRRGD